MRKLSGLILVVLAVVVLVSMPSFKGLNMIQLNRANDLPVGPDPNGALGITGLDQGLNGAIPIGGSALLLNQYIGTITNNFAFPVQLDVTVTIRVTEFTYSGTGEPRWRTINVYIDREEVGGIRAAVLRYNDMWADDTPQQQQRTTAPIILNPGESLAVSLDRRSRLSRFNRVTSFRAEALFSIVGSRVGSGASSFIIEPAGDLRKQYFIRAN